MQSYFSRLFSPFRRNCALGNVRSYGTRASFARCFSGLFSCARFLWFRLRAAMSQVTILISSSPQCYSWTLFRLIIRSFKGSAPTHATQLPWLGTVERLNPGTKNCNISQDILEVFSARVWQLHLSKSGPKNIVVKCSHGKNVAGGPAFFLGAVLPLNC